MKRILTILCIFIFLWGCNSEKEESVDSKNAAVDFKKSGITELTGSRKIEELICQCWENEEDAGALESTSQNSVIEYVSRGICFYSDGSFTKNPRGDIKTGKWELKKEIRPYKVNLIHNNADEESFQLALLTPSLLKLSDKEKNIITYYGNALASSIPTRSPFHSSMNTWRVKPGKPESDSMIKERLKGNIDFFISFYELMIHTDAKTISFYGFPSCFRWYSGGIYMQKEEDLQEKWIQCFYNREQAMNAYTMAEKLLSKKYQWPEKEPNWLKLNVSVLKQMRMKTDSIN